MVSAGRSTLKRQEGREDEKQAGVAGGYTEHTFSTVSTDAKIENSGTAVSRKADTAWTSGGDSLFWSLILCSKSAR